MMQNSTSFIADPLASSCVAESERYRQFSNFVEERRPELVHPDNTDLLSLVQRANELPHSDQTPETRLLDARLFQSLTRCGDVKGRRLSIGRETLNPLEVVLAIREAYKVEKQRLNANEEEMGQVETEIRIDWERLGTDMFGFFAEAPGMNCLKGFAKPIEIKKRKAIVRRRRENPSSIIDEPEQREARDLATSITDTERIISRLWNILMEEENENGILLMELTLDHDSFPQTVLNVFHTMFLVKDLKVTMIVMADGKELIRPNKTRRGRHVNNKQRSISLTVDRWMQWCAQIPRHRCRMTNNHPEDEDHAMQE